MGKHKGLWLPVYSYRVDCVECVDYKHNWLKCIAVAYLSQTVFYTCNCNFQSINYLRFAGGLCDCQSDGGNL